MYQQLYASLIIILCICGQCQSEQSFGIDFDRNTFVKDGKPFQYISGLNAIQTYVFWDQHELVEGVYNFDDTNDLVAFLQLAQKIGFVVILRVGP
ncbi:unnamed protein product [Adineta steineri]|uniref:Glycoside hydrolase 35 catalytic domain-containing protein n=1 Tax=Adineta steineri TaxID=433720 RepID=A0A813PQ81_9BILA|nr:unnamed protein product [Adineta steineri]CAF0753804.1 unnamed protein product [Adineta steineri]